MARAARLRVDSIPLPFSLSGMIVFGEAVPTPSKSGASFRRIVLVGERAPASPTRVNELVPSARGLHPALKGRDKR
jgi:hypothetical protein